MSEERRRAPALATRVDDVPPNEKDWTAPSTARSSCLNCGTVLPEEGAKFCPECGKSPMGEPSMHVDGQPVGPTAHVVVEVRAPAASAAVPIAAPSPVRPPARRRKGLHTLTGEAEEEGRNFRRFVIGLSVAALIAGIIWLVTSHPHQTPAPLPVSTMPITIMPYDAGR